MLQHGSVVLGPEHRPCFLSPPPASKFWHCLGPSSLLVQRGTPHTPLVQRGTVSAADVFFPLSPPDFLLIWGAFLFFALSDFLVSRMAGAGHYRISIHTAKPPSQTAKYSPRVAHGEAPTAATGTAKAEFAVCQISGTWQTPLPCVCRGTRCKKARRRCDRNLTASG